MSWRNYRNLQGLILIGWALFLLDKITSARILLYINRRYVFLTFLTVLAFVALAQAVMDFQKRKEKVDGHHAHLEEGENATPSRPPVWGLAIMGLPLLLGFIIPAKTLDSGNMANRGINTQAPLSRLANANTTSVSLDSADRSVLDWIGVFNDTPDPDKFDRQPANVTGFVYHDKSLAKNQFMVGRFVVTCCVADAIALGMVVDWPGADKLPENAWVQVQGPIYVAAYAGGKLPGITASSVSPISTPDDPYLFP